MQWRDGGNVVCGSMVFCEEIFKIDTGQGRVDNEVTLVDSVMYPIKSHANGMGSVLFDGVNGMSIHCLRSMVHKIVVSLVLIKRLPNLSSAAEETTILRVPIVCLSLVAQIMMTPYVAMGTGFIEVHVTGMVF